MPPTAPLKREVLKEKLTSSIASFTLSSYPKFQHESLSLPDKDQTIFQPIHPFFLSYDYFPPLSFNPLPSTSLPRFPLMTLPDISQTPTQSHMRTSMDHHHHITHACICTPSLCFLCSFSYLQSLNIGEL